jgi:hypothetical protein
MIPLNRFKSGRPDSLKSRVVERIMCFVAALAEAYGIGLRSASAQWCPLGHPVAAL